MAYRKVNDNSLVSVADPIRSKGGTSDALVFPDGFVSAISAIQTGGGGAQETWVIKSSAGGEFATTQISFTSNGQKFTSIGANGVGTFIVLHYDNNEVAGYDPGVGGGYEFDNEAYRKLTFDTPPTGDLLTWLQSNAVKQPDDTAVQDTKALTITSNGTVSVTPDAPYDGLSSVDVTVNVSGGGGGGIIDSLQLINEYFSFKVTDVRFNNCTFTNCATVEFWSTSTNVSFTMCYFGNTIIKCTQSIRDAIENDSSNLVENVQFDIVT